MASQFFERYSELCKSAGETPNSVAKAIGASSGSVTAWKNGTEPRHSTIAKIAEYLNVSIGYLSGEEKMPVHIQHEHDIMDEVDVAFYGDYKELSDDDKETIRDMVRLMRQRREKK